MTRLLALGLLLGLSGPPARAESKPKWIVAHKVNQLTEEYLREVLWFTNPSHYPPCFGNLGNKGAEESLDAFFDPSGHYNDANGIEFDVWYVDPGQHINDLGADQQDIHGNDLVAGRWYVSHDPCDDEHVPLAEHVGRLKSKLDTYGTGRIALLYVDMKALKGYAAGTFDPIVDVRSALRSGLGTHYRQISVIYSTADYTDRGAFTASFISTLWDNELIGIDEDNDDAAGDDTEAARVAVQWARDRGAPPLYMSDDTDATRIELARLFKEEGYPHLVGGWTISSDDDTAEGDNDDAKGFWDEGVNLFLLQNYFEGDDGTGAYTYLSRKISDDADSHLASGCDRPWNQQPVANAGGGYVGHEGAPVTFDASASTDPNGSALEYRWDFENDGTWDTGWSSGPTAQHTWDDDHSGTVRLEARDGCLSATATASVQVRNVAPDLGTLGGSTIVENGIATVSGTFSDPGANDTFTITVAWGDGASESFVAAAGSGSFSRTHRYLDDDPTSTSSDVIGVSVTVADKDGGSDTGPVGVVVHNVAPAFGVLSGATIDEDGFATVGGTFADPGTLDHYTLTIDWGEGSPQSFTYGVGTRSFSETHRYRDDNPTGTSSDSYAVGLTLTDDDTGAATGGVVVVVRNVAPVANIDRLVDESNTVLNVDDVLLVGLSVAIQESYADVGAQDTRTARRSWGDGTAVEPLGTVTGLTSGAHTYSAPGTYTIRTDATDDDTGVGTATRDVIVVSPAGAVEDAVGDLQGATSSDAEAMDWIRRANAALNGGGDGTPESGALDKIAAGDYVAAMVKIGQALEALAAAEAEDPSLDFEAIEKLLALTAKSIAVEAVDLAATIATGRGQLKQLGRARDAITNGQLQLLVADYVGAVEWFEEALQKALAVLDDAGLAFARDTALRPAGDTRVERAAAVGEHGVVSGGESGGTAMSTIPGGFELRAAGPNPGRGRCDLDLELSAGMAVTADVVDITGRAVASLGGPRSFAPGLHRLSWDGLRATGDPAPAGVYLIRVRSASSVRVWRTVITR